MRAGGSTRRMHFILWVVALIAAACTSAPKASPSPAGSPVSTAWTDQATIAFHSDPGSHDDTYVMNGRGTDVAAVTAGMETIAQPTWSPDGERLVVACCTSEQGHLFVIDGPGAAPVELAPDTPGAVNPAWSPDGSTIAFESIADRSLYVVDMSGSVPGTPRPLGVSGSGPSWSPDGGRIAYFAGVDSDIYSVAADATGVERLTRDAAPDYSPQWSPDGRHIAFVSERDGDQEIYAMNADGSGQIDVSNDPSADDFPAWSPNGHLIAYVAYLDGADPLTIGKGNAEIFVVSVDGSHRRDVSRNPAWDGDPAWSPDGSLIAFTRRTDHAEVHVMRSDGADEHRLRGTRGGANDCCPAWRP